MNSSPKWKRHF